VHGEHAADGHAADANGRAHRDPARQRELQHALPRARAGVLWRGGEEAWAVAVRRERGHASKTPRPLCTKQGARVTLTTHAPGLAAYGLDMNGQACCVSRREEPLLLGMPLGARARTW